jgi:hypothetical protein
MEFLAILLDKEMYDLPKVKSLQEVYRCTDLMACGTAKYDSGKVLY